MGPFIHKVLATGAKIMSKAITNFSDNGLQLFFLLCDSEGISGLFPGQEAVFSGLKNKDEPNYDLFLRYQEFPSIRINASAASKSVHADFEL